MSDVAFLYYLLHSEITNTSLFDKYRSLLAAEERQRIDSLVFQRHRRERLMARAMLRKALSDLTGLNPLIWQFRTNMYGRPEIEAPSEYRNLKFSVSHAGGLIACLLGWHREVGLDIEPIRRIEGMLNIADQHFAISETDSLRTLLGDQRCRRFLELWTLKESYLKARGSGLLTPLREVAFLIKESPNDQISAAFGAGVADDPARWQFNLERLYDHVIAITVEQRCRVRAKILRRNALKLMNCP